MELLNFVGQADLDLVLLNWGTSEIGFHNSEWITEFIVDYNDAMLIGQSELDEVLLNWGFTITDVPELIGDFNSDGMVTFAGDFSIGMSMEQAMDTALGDGEWIATNLNPYVTG